MSTSDKSIPLPKFSGERKDFQSWWTKFRGFAVAKGMSELLFASTANLPESESTELDENDPAEAKKIEHRRKNAYLMAYLTNAFQKQQDLLLVCKTMSKEWPGGKGYEVIERLMTKYRPQDVITDVELHQRLSKVTMGKRENPDNIFEKLAEIKNWYDTPDKQLDTSLIVTTVLGAAPKEYTTTLKQELKEQGLKAGESTSKVDVDKLQAAMVEHYRMVYGSDEDDNNKTKKEGQEYTLAVHSDKKCYNCQEVGHISKNCPKKNNKTNNENGASKFKGKCNECGKQGHKAAQCWKKAGNEHLQPEWYKKKEKTGEVNAASTDGKSAEGSMKEYSLTIIDLMEENNYMEEVSSDVEEEQNEKHEPVADGYVPDDFFDTFGGDSNAEENDDDDEMPEWAYGGENEMPEWAYGDEKENEDNQEEVEVERAYDCDTEMMDVRDCEDTRDCDEPTIMERGSSEMALATENGVFDDNMRLLSDPNVWIVDSGASLHSTGDTQGMINMVRSVDGHTTVGNGNRVRPKAMGDIPVEVTTKNMEKVFDGKLTQVQHMVGSPFNLLSVTRLFLLGWKLQDGDVDHMTFIKGNLKIRCDIKVKTNKGFLFAVYLKRKTSVIEELAQATVQARSMTVNEAHRLYGHHDEATTRKIAERMNVHVTRGAMVPCESCGLGKAKQKNVANNNNEEKETKKATSPNERIYADLTTVKKAEGKEALYPHMWLLVDEYSGTKFVKCFKTKIGMVEPTCQLFSQWRERGKPVKYLRMDNGGENQKLEARLKSADWKLHPVIEYTTRDTPQHNHLAEVAIATIVQKGRTMMIEAKLPDEMKYLLQHKAMETAAKLDGMVIVTIDGQSKSRFEHWSSGQLPKFSAHVRNWGEAGIVKIASDMSSKLQERGTICMFIGYCDDHGSDAYEMFNPKTKRYYKTRDVIWLKRMFYNDNNVEVIMQPVIEQENKEKENNDEVEDDDDPPNPEIQNDVEDVNDDEGTEDNEAGTDLATRPKRNIRAPARLIEEIGSIALDRAIENIAFEIAAVGAGVGGGYANTAELRPMKYDEAMSGPDKEEWKKAVEEEHERMLTHKVWTPVKRSQVPKGAKIISTTWAMKKKANGKFRARLNARGFEQVEGVHYQKKSVAAPTVHAMSVNIAFILIATGRLDVDLNDVHGAFLNGKFSNGETIYITIPQGFEKYYSDDEVLLLLKTIYGLVQSAYEYFIVWLKAVKTIGLKQSKADPCVYFRWTDLGLNLWTSWVDDILSCGRNEDLKKGRIEIKKFFGIDEQGGLEEYVGCKVEYNQEEGIILLSQPVLIQSFIDEFDLGNNKSPKTPATPGSVLIQGEVLLNEERHRNYRKGVGKLIHLSKMTRPDILNAVRELSRFGGSPTEAHEAEMYRCMNFCVSTRHWKLKIQPNVKWDGKEKDTQFIIYGKSDSTFASVPETMRSVMGYCAYLNGAAYSRKSLMEKVVATSVTEAETIAATECVKDMLFGKELIESMGMTVQLPMIIYIDNRGAVDLFNGWSIAGNTRHIATRLSFVRELKDEGIIEIQWVSTNDNEADMFTKNLDGSTFMKHSDIFMHKGSEDDSIEAID